jgi:hypothetical protein
MPAPQANPPPPGKRPGAMDTKEVRQVVVSTMDSRIVLGLSGIVATIVLATASMVLMNRVDNVRQDEALNGVKETLGELKSENRANFQRLEALIRANP